MNNIELQALRRLLFFTQQEAATLVSGTSHRAWQHWEDGKRAVPLDVSESIAALANWRVLAIRAAHDAMQHAPDIPKVMVYYERMVDWVGEPIKWRPHQSACAHLISFDVKLVAFDSVNYKQWLGDREDSSSLRGAWAAFKATNLQK